MRKDGKMEVEIKLTREDVSLCVTAMMFAAIESEDRYGHKEQAKEIRRVYQMIQAQHTS